MKKALLFILISLTYQVYAQQMPLYSAHYMNPYLYNPSMAGAEGNTHVFLTHCIQWNGFQGAPSTSAFTFEKPIKKRNISLGLTMYNDLAGIIRRFGTYGTYAYTVHIDEHNKLLLGASAGFIDTKIDFSSVVVKDYSDPYISNQSLRKTVIDGNVGATYNWKQLWAGISVFQMLGNSARFTDNNTHAYYNLASHVITSVKYTFDISKEDRIKMSPLFILRTIPGTISQFDLNVTSSWKETLWFNLCYKSKYAVGISIAVKFYDHFKVGYNYDIITSPIRSYTGISNQIMLSYTFGIAVKDSSGVRLKDRNEEVYDLKEQLKLNDEQMKQLRLQIDSLNNEIVKSKEEINNLIIKAQEELKLAGKSNVNTTENINLLQLRIQSLEEKLKLIISMMGE